MKNLILTIYLALFSALAIAQTPDAFNYQFVVRDLSGKLVMNQTVNIIFSIIDKQSGEQVLYQEQNGGVTTDNGMLSCNIGTGEPVLGEFGSINWGKGGLALKIDIDFENTGTFVYLRTIDFLSVPYAFYANKIENTVMDNIEGGLEVPYCETCDAASEGVIRYEPLLGKMQFCDGTGWHNLDGTYYLGEKAQGGIIVQLDFSNLHGLVVAENDIVTYWGCVGTLMEGGTGAQSYDFGSTNTADILYTCTDTESAAAMCDALSVSDYIGIYDDWYLPAINELTILLDQIGLLPNLSVVEGDSKYWSSTQVDGNTVWIIDIIDSSQQEFYRDVPTNLRVRPMRSF